MSGQGEPQAPSRGRRACAWLDYGVSVIATGKPPITADEQRRNREAFMRQTRELTEIALSVTLMWALAALTAAWHLRPALPAIRGWGGVLVAFVWCLKISQIVMNRRRLRPWRESAR
ncbi:MAG: hypothetical protein B7Z58_13860 [Acidiphilium sp. 37-64-53]|uniref:hypothetical protein n=1 Tax=Acidiphilium TaxID=522 RepID=UPI000BDD2895|nr:MULTISPECIES: hypothetical protein [Acidiphilium]OYW00825.1 MAG: hypothetical protein B7Z58_13860 [Acidiphilium sp. 37-64-53]HQT84925.1 hypothetical protein [Acidiphilium rubrum]